MIFEGLLAEIGEKIAGITGDLARLEWLRLKTQEEFAALRAEAARLELYTEAEAAKILKVSERALADLRRAHRLPHCSFGKKPRYTREQLKEICRVLESRPRGKAYLKVA